MWSFIAGGVFISRTAVKRSGRISSAVLSLAAFDGVQLHVVLRDQQLHLVLLAKHLGS